MKMNTYILEDHKLILESDIIIWAKWMASTKNTVCKIRKGNITVSTVFLGIDHNFTGGEVPILFETMVFGGRHDQLQQRCSTWEQACAQHIDVCAKVFG